LWQKAGGFRQNERIWPTQWSKWHGPRGFEASVHKIKEQVLPRLLERVDPEAAATLTKDELSEEFRPIILEVLAELKLT
jgi:pilus assembly protein CpaF